LINNRQSKVSLESLKSTEQRTAKVTGKRDEFGIKKSKLAGFEPYGLSEIGTPWRADLNVGIGHLKDC